MGYTTQNKFLILGLCCICAWICLVKVLYVESRLLQLKKKRLT